MCIVDFYTRQGCHLCDVALAVVERVGLNVPFTLRVVDVDSDAALAARYGWEVPVVVVDGRKHAKFRVDEGAFRRRLAAPSASVPLDEIDAIDETQP